MTKEPLTKDWRNQRVTLMGLGRHGGGVGAARYLARQGAHLTVTDLADRQALADSLTALGEMPIARWRLGEHVAEDFAQADAVIVNPAVPPGNAWVELARSRGVQILSEIEIFLQACPARVMGVTGSNGKSTTASLLAAMLAADGRRVWLGGNIGRSLLGDLRRMSPEDWVVLELSSFQLHYLSDAIPWPEVAVVTGCATNHLDWHGSYDHYQASKQRLLTGQQACDLAVLNPWDRGLDGWDLLAQGRLASDFVLPVMRNLPGRHNQANAACARAAALGVGCGERAIGQALDHFQGLPHRLQWVGDVRGRRFYNDSKATTPEAASAAVASFDAPVWLLAGGHAKGGDYASLMRHAAERCKGAAFFGSAGPMFYELLQQQRGAEGCLAGLSQTLPEALDWCWRQSAPGDVILLSPACASFDQFRDYADRGETFVRMVRELSR